MSGCHPFPSGNGTAATQPGAKGVLLRLRSQMDVGSRVLFCLWLLLMILLPHSLSLGVQPVLLLTLTLSTLSQVGLVLSLLCSA